MKERIVAYFGDGLLFECYGSTEASIVSALAPQDQLRKEQCVGLPFPCTAIRLLDDAGREVPVGEVGELYSRSPYLFNGYWRRPEDAAKGFRDGWFTAGDLARQDEEGYSTSSTARTTRSSPAASTSTRARSRRSWCAIRP